METGEHHSRDKNFKKYCIGVLIDVSEVTYCLHQLTGLLRTACRILTWKHPALPQRNVDVPAKRSSVLDRQNWLPLGGGGIVFDSTKIVKTYPILSYIAVTGRRSEVALRAHMQR